MKLIRPSILVALLLAVLLLPASLLAQNPSCPIVPCSGNGVSSPAPKFLVGGVPQNDVTIHVGDTLFYQVGVAVPADQSCAVTNVNAFLGFPDGSIIQFLSQACIAGNGGSITCPGDPACINTDLLRYTVGTVQDDVGKAFSLSEPNELPDGGTNTCFVAPGPNRVGAVVNVVGLSVSPTAVNLYSSCNSITALVIAPCIACTNFCTNNVGENGTVFFSGTVSNCGMESGSKLLRNIVVSNLVNGVLTLVTNLPQLDAGQSASFGGSYSNGNICSPITNTIFVSGIDLATAPYAQTNSSSYSATCSNILSPCIKVTANCDPHSVPVDGTVTFSGTVTNCGDVALTNVELHDSFLGNVLATFPRLERGGTVGSSQSYSAIYVATAADCAPDGSLTNTIIATGRDFCNTLAVQDAASCAFRVHCQPRFTNLAIRGSELVLSGCGGSSAGTYTVLTTTNLAMPLWVPIATNTLGIDGQFTFTNYMNSNESERYFRLLLQ
jgi:hypothetical protein